MDDDEVPPLEDMSEILQQAEVIRSKVNSSQGKQSVDPSPRGAVPQKGQGTKKPKEKSSDTQKVKSAEKNASSTPSKSSSSSFGGFKKGFLFRGNNSSKSNSKATSSSPSGSGARSSSDLPYITKKSTSESRTLPEVQQTLSAEAQKIAQNKDEWLTDVLMKKIEANDALFKKLGDPRYVETVNQFQTDPVRAMEQYKDNKEIQDFLTSFCKVMGEHFTGLADQQDKATKPSKPEPPPSKIVELNSDSEVNRAKTTPSHIINPNRSETVYTRSPTEGVDMSVRSSTNPNQATAEDERRMQEILANPEIRNILMDPQIMNLIETLKFNPDEGASHIVQVSCIGPWASCNILQGNRVDQEKALLTSSTLYVGNLSYYTTEEQIHELFGKCGDIKRIIMGLDKVKKTPCGFCFVEYYTREDAENAMRYINGTRLDDRIIRTDWDHGFKEGRQYRRGKSGGQVEMNTEQIMMKEGEDMEK